MATAVLIGTAGTAAGQVRSKGTAWLKVPALFVAVDPKTATGWAAGPYPSVLTEISEKTNDHRRYGYGGVVPPTSGIYALVGNEIPASETKPNSAPPGGGRNGQTSPVLST